MRIVLLLLLLGSLTVRAAAQTVSGASFVDPTVRIPPGAQDGTSEISLRTPTAVSSVPTITDAPLPRPPAATVTFEPLGSNSVPSNIWRYRVMISGLSPATPAQQHYALVSYDNKKDQAVPYVLSNQSSSFSWSVSKLPDPWVVSPWKPDSVCTTFAVTPRDAPATGVTINSNLVEQSTKTAITMDKFKLCVVGTDCESTQTIDLPANATSQLKLCTTESFHGNYRGVASLSARQKPDGEVILQNVQFSSLLAKALGFVVIWGGVYIAWLSKVWARARVERDQALIPSIVMRAQLEKLRETIEHLPDQYQKVLVKIPAAIQDLLDQLSVATLDQRQFLPPKFPGPFGFTVDSAGYKSYLEARNPQIQLLALLINNGVMPAVAQDTGSMTVDKQSMVKAAVQQIDDLTTVSADAARVQIPIILANLKKGLSGVTGAAEAALQTITAARELEVLQVEVQSIGKWIWLIYGLLTALTGLAVLILGNPGFGVPIDFIFAFFWGFGLPTTIQALAPGSAVSALNVSVAKV